MTQRRVRWAAAAVLALLVAAWPGIPAGECDPPVPAAETAPATETAAPATETAAPAAPAEDQPFRDFKLYVQDWAWDPSTLRVGVGTKVILYIHSFDASRTFELKEFGLKVPLPEGKTVKAEFLADRAGTFTWRCGRPCGDGCAKLKGTLIVH